MKFNKKSLAILLALGLAGCANNAETENNNKREVETKEEVNNNDQSEKPEEKEEQIVEDKNQAHYDVNLSMLKGPTSAGAINMVDWSKNDDDPKFSFNESVEGAPDAVIPQLVSGESDMAIIPPNLAATVYNKTEGKIKVLAINNLGVLYLVENADLNINSIEDLVNSGEAIYTSAKGATPDLAINEVIKDAGFNESDVDIEYLAEASEVAQKMIAGEAKVALLPEPMVTNVLMKSENAKVALDINELYEKETGNPLISAVLVARSDYLEDIDVPLLLETYKKSIEEANSNVDATAALLDKYDIMPEVVAKKALPKLALTYIDGEQMQTMIKNHLEYLYQSNPQLVGGSLPEDDFYYTK
ncbi:ABC transporter substrate-binding protein [Anaerococcus octavius]|uniref:Sulfonate/nitrate/taurine transporter substrate-binding protein n=1 Tax=Anaerococcus octavius TaxID=54007 RepID=A0A2I1MAL3_9FIRM|nr:MqnA/MqnD/SBP family protein [Anaerococcus octavius]PKZ17175.1 sulfonate/nitrate/taurine transporter substrate-binding protein [Anaerococcus octavius]